MVKILKKVNEDANVLVITDDSIPSGGDVNNLGYYTTDTALTIAHPTGIDGNYAIVGTTDTIWIWDGDTNTWKNSGLSSTLSDAPIDGNLYVRKNGAWVNETNNINDIYNHIQVDANLDLSATGYVHKSIYHIQPAGGTITITIPDVASSTDGSRAIFTIHEPGTVIVKTLSGELIENSPEQILTTGAFTIISLGSHYIVTQDSRPKIQNTSLNFYTLNEDSVISNGAGGFYKQSANSITDSRYNQSTATELNSVAITGNDILGYGAISDSSTVTGIIPEGPIATTLSIRKISGNANFNYHVSFYKRTAGGVETLLCTTTNSAAITSNTHSQVTVIGTLPQTSFISTDTLVRKIFLNKVGAGTDPVAGISVEGTTPSYSIISISAGSISHNALAGIQQANTGVTNGHISDQAQSIYGIKTFENSLGLKEITTPDTPASGYERLYFKADGKLYKLNSAGVETEVGGVGGASFNGINGQSFNFPGEIVPGKIAELTAFNSGTFAEMQISTLTRTTGTTTVTVKKNGVAIGTATITSATSATNGRYYGASADLADSFVTNDVITIEVTDTGSPYGTGLIINLK